MTKYYAWLENKKPKISTEKPANFDDLQFKRSFTSPNDHKAMLTYRAILTMTIPWWSER